MTEHTLSIVFPIFNEERRLPALLERLPGAVEAAAQAGLELRQVLLMNDGSTDGTTAVLRDVDDLGGRLTVQTTAPNRGKGAAVRRGMLQATSEFGLMCDADLSTPLDELVPLMAAMRRGADVVIASRAMDGSDIVVHQPRHRELMGKGFNVLIRTVTGLPWRDTQCGFKLFRPEDRPPALRAAACRRIRIRPRAPGHGPSARPRGRRGPGAVDQRPRDARRAVHLVLCDGTRHRSDRISRQAAASGDSARELTAVSRARAPQHTSRPRLRRQRGSVYRPGEPGRALRQLVAAGGEGCTASRRKRRTES